jgi:dCMP deaminase
MALLIESKPMEKWDQRFCDMAKFVSEWSKDPNAKVGAVVYSKKGGDISIGFNGFPMG